MVFLFYSLVFRQPQKQRSATHCCYAFHFIGSSTHVVGDAITEKKKTKLSFSLGLLKQSSQYAAEESKLLTH